MDNNMDKYLGTCLDDRYEIVEVIGAGGMAVVYKAIDQRLNRFVAVKILRDELARDEEFRARFQIEAQAVATVDDANVPDETVAEVYQKGYKMGSKVLRPAMVTVTSGGPKREKAPDEGDKDKK